MIIDTLRPISTQADGSYTAQPSGTLHGVTSDNNDTTYALSGSPNTMRLSPGTHTPAAGHERHMVRARMRGRVSTGTGSVGYRPRFLSNPPATINIASLTTTPTDYVGSWSAESVLNLATAGALLLYLETGGADGPATPTTGVRVQELYIDYDTRAQPTFVPQILDGAGVDRSGGTVTDSNIVTARFTNDDYDGLTARSWRVAIYTLAQTLAVGFDPFVTVPISDADGSGAPVDSQHLLGNDDYVAYFQDFSNIRLGDAFASDIETVSFTVDASPALAPANMTVTPLTDPPAFQICWDAPADAANWSEPENVYAEITRTDCNGTSRIALIPDALDTCYIDRFAPIANAGEFCGAPDHECEVCYDVRYWGYRAVTVEPITTAIPSGVIFAWPDTVASIPSNWSRVAALDDRYPKGVATAATNPGGTGGAATHGHTVGQHQHDIRHAHAQATTGPAPSPVNRNAIDTQEPVSASDHVHTRPTTSFAEIDSTLTAPAVVATANEAPRKDVVFVESTGVDATVPAGMLGIAHAATPPSGWQLEDSNGAGASARPPYWKGAPVAADGSLAFVAEPAHLHALSAHTHNGVTHGHTSAPTGDATTETTSRRAGAPTDPGPEENHDHSIAVTNAATGNLASGGADNSGTGAGALASDPLFRLTSFIESVTGEQQLGLIGLWMGTIAAIPLGWLLCDGTNGTPDFIARYPRHKGSLSVNLTGGGAAHGHAGPADHGHTIGAHSHITTLGAADQAIAQVAGAATPQTHNENSPHAHSGAASTDNATPPVVAGAVGATSSDTSEPEHIEAAFIMLAEDNSTPTSTQLLVASEIATFCVEAQLNPDGSGCDWIRGFIDGDICICPTRTFIRSRPFARFQPIGGGIPTVTSGAPGGRDYTLDWPVTSEADLEICEAILAQTLVHYTPVGQRPLFMAPDPLSVSKVKIRDMHHLTASFIEVLAPPVADPADVIPEPAPGSPGSPSSP